MSVSRLRGWNPSGHEALRSELGSPGGARRTRSMRKYPRWKPQSGRPRQTLRAGHCSPGPLGGCPLRACGAPAAERERTPLLRSDSESAASTRRVRSVSPRSRSSRRRLGARTRPRVAATAFDDVGSPRPPPFGGSPARSIDRSVRATRAQHPTPLRSLSQTGKPLSPMLLGGPSRSGRALGADQPMRFRIRSMSLTCSCSSVL